MSDARSLLRAKRAATETRISHPYASYSSTNQLKCTICNSVIKHASAWEGHLGSKAHRVGVARVRAEQEAAGAAAREEAARLRNEEEERMKEERERELDVQRRQRDEQEDEQEQLRAGSKRKADEDSSMTSPGNAEKSKGKKTKKVRIEEGSSGMKEGFPADFFSDPSRSIPAFTNDSDEEEEEGEDGQAMAVDAQAPKTAIDDEFEMFQREMAASQPQDRAQLFAQATVEAQPEMFSEEHISGGFAKPRQPGEAAETEDAAGAPIPMTEEEKAEAKRKQREEDDRELIMDRLLEEERIQEEADMRVQAMKNRMEALKKRREARKAGAKAQS
jgi:zinc finger protein 830